MVVVPCCAANLGLWGKVLGAAPPWHVDLFRALHCHFNPWQERWVQLALSNSLPLHRTGRPFHIVAPGIDMRFANERAACWACTAWIQLMFGVVLPTALLLAGRQSVGTSRQQTGGPLPPGQSTGAAAAAAAGADAAGASQEAPAGGRRSRAVHRLLSWLDQAFSEEPLLMSLFAAGFVWVLLRAATGLLFER